MLLFAVQDGDGAHELNPGFSRHIEDEIDGDEKRGVIFPGVDGLAAADGGKGAELRQEGKILNEDADGAMQRQRCIGNKTQTVGADIRGG